MANTRICKDCHTEYPLNKEHFGHQPNGNFRYSCRKCMADRTRQHYKDKPQFQAARIEARRERNEAVGAISKAEETKIIQTLIRRDGQICFYCKTPVTFWDRAGLDHMTPLVKGGTNELSNFALACSKCNGEKHNKTVNEYRQWLIERGYRPKF